VPADPPSAVDTFALMEGSGVFVSVAKAREFIPIALIEELKLVPYFYGGLYELPPGQTTNLHIEAEDDLERCQVFVLVMPLSPRGKLAERPWGCSQLDVQTRIGKIKGFLYLPLVESIPESEDISTEIILPPYAVIRNAPNCQSLNSILRQDLLSLMQTH